MGIDEPLSSLDRGCRQGYKLVKNLCSPLDGQDIEVSSANRGQEHISFGHQTERVLINLPFEHGPAESQFAGGDDLLGNERSGNDSARSLAAAQFLSRDAELWIGIKSCLKSASPARIDRKGKPLQARIPLQGHVRQFVEG